MVKNKPYKPLFLGLSHLGQVFSVSWAKKIGKCLVYDFDNKQLEIFKKKKYTIEEPSLNLIKTKNIEFLNYDEDIKKNNLIFFTYDTPINEKNGDPNLSSIEKNLKKLLSIKFNKKTFIFVLSQVYPGFMDNIVKKYKHNKNVKLYYMVDTLRMGTAINNFLNPEQLVFGSEGRENKIVKLLFKKCKCQKYIYSYKEAELIKISLNIYLFFSVSFANVIDQLGMDNNIIFSKVIQNLRNDNRIGKYSYVNPSIGVSGGHLERDIQYFKKINKNNISKNILSLMLKFNDYRKKIIDREISKKIKKKIKKILIIGNSYKENSYSTVNSPFKFLLNKRNYQIYAFDDCFKLKEKKNIKVINNTNNLGIFDVVIYNYSKPKNKIKVMNYFLKKRNNYLFNISLNRRNNFNGPNVINFF